MKKTFLLSILFLIIFSASNAATNPSMEDGPDPNVATHLIVLGAKKDYYEALKIAKTISQKSGIPYDDEGMVYDKKRGLIEPDDSSDEMYRGVYFLRRYNGDTNYISVEKSEAYPGMQKGFYVVLGGIAEKPEEAKKLLTLYKKSAPDSYIQKTHIYMGCMH